MPLPPTDQPTSPIQTPATNPAPARGHRGPLPEDGHRQLTVLSNGTVTLRGISFLVSHPLAGQQIHAVWDPAGVIFADANGEVLAEYPQPPRGTRYVSKYDPNDPTRTRPGRPRKNPPPPSPKS